MQNQFDRHMRLKITANSPKSTQIPCVFGKITCILAKFPDSLCVSLQGISFGHFPCAVGTLICRDYNHYSA